MGFTSTTVKYILFFFNFFIAVCGAIIFGFSIYIWKSGQSDYTNITKEDITTPCVIFAIIGAFVFIVAFLGCCGAIQDSSCMMKLYAMILLALLILEIAVVGLAIWKKANIENAISNAMEKTFQDPQNKASIDEMQQSFHCCGSTGPEFYSGDIPESCYSQGTHQKYTEGCISKFTSFIKENLQKLMYVGIGVGVVEIVGVIFGLYYASHINRYSGQGYA